MANCISADICITIAFSFCILIGNFNKEQSKYMKHLFLQDGGNRCDLDHLLSLNLPSMFVNLFLLRFEESDMAWIQLLFGTLIFNLSEVSKHNLVHYVSNHNAKYSFGQL